MAEQLMVDQLLAGRTALVTGGGTGMAPAGRVLTIMMNCH